MCVIIFVHIWCVETSIFSMYIKYIYIYTCVCTYYKRPMNFHSSLQMSFVLQYAPYCISMRKPDSAGCLIGWFQFHGAHDLIKTFVTVGYNTILVEFTLQLKIIQAGWQSLWNHRSMLSTSFNVFFFLGLCRGSLATATWLPRMRPTKAEAKVTWEALWSNS